MLTFVVYYAVAVAKNDHSILAGQAFASLSLISLVTLSALAFIKAIPAQIQCVSSFDRIQEYCSQPVRPRHLLENSDIPQSIRINRSTESEVELATRQSNYSQTSHNQPIVRFRDHDVAWEKSGAPTLRSLRAEIYERRFTVVLGPTGSGKSTLLETILDETISLNGDADRRFSATAYCAQLPWLINGTIRDNILADYAGQLDEKFYATVLWACGLESDIASLRQRDLTLVGNGGSNLSGGQRQRVVSDNSQLLNTCELKDSQALARAVYSRKNTVLLDDVFSGVDTRNVALISDRLLGHQGLFRKSLTTVVLVTHSRKLKARPNG